jgi:hypothetical protein
MADKLVQVGDQVIAFPDTMSDDDISKVLSGQAGTQQPKPEPRSMGQEIGRQVGLTVRGGLQGAADVAGLVLNPAANLVNLAAGKQVLQPFSQAASNLMTAAGLPEPQGAVEKAVQSGVGAMSGTGLQAVIAKQTPIAAAFTKDLVKQFTAAGAGGTAGQAAGDYVTEITNDPYAGFAAALVTGGVAGGFGGKAIDTTTAVKNYMTGKTPTTYSMSDIKNRAQASYRTMEDQQIYVKNDSLTKKLFSNIDSRLADENFNPQIVDTHKPVAQVLNQMKDMSQDPFISFTKVEQMRSAMTELKKSGDNATKRLAGAVVSEFDNYLASIGNKDVFSLQGDVKTALDSVKSARQDWRNLSRAETIEDALKYAEVSADRPTSSKSELIRTAMINLARDNRKMNLFSETERNAIRAVAKGGSLDTIFSMFAKFNPERSTLVQAGTLAGAYARPEISLPIAAGGYLSDKALGMLRQNAGQKLVNQVASGTLQPIPANMAWRGMLSGISGE